MIDLTYRKGVVAIIFDNDYRFLLIQPKGWEAKDWNFPGGGLDEGEDLIQGLGRELKEELNLEKSDVEIIGKTTKPLQYNYSQEVIQKGIAAGKNYKGQIKERFLLKYIGNVGNIKVQEEEINEFKWVPFKELSNHLLLPDQYNNALEAIKEFLPELV